MKTYRYNFLDVTVQSVYDNDAKQWRNELIIPGIARYSELSVHPCWNVYKARDFYRRIAGEVL